MWKSKKIFTIFASKAKMSASKRKSETKFAFRKKKKKMFCFTTYITYFCVLMLSFAYFY